MGVISSKVESTDHVSLTCRNHPDLRWMTKNIDYIGARSIFFRGGWSTVIPFAPVWKDAFPMEASPVTILKARLSGINPYTNQPMPDAEPYRWEDVVKFVEWVQSLESEYTFECDCKFSELIVAPEDAPTDKVAS